MSGSWRERKEARRLQLEKASAEAKARKVREREAWESDKFEFLKLVDKSLRIKLTFAEEQRKRFVANMRRFDVRYEETRVRSRKYSVPDEHLAARDRYADLVLFIACGAVKETAPVYLRAKEEAAELAQLLNRTFNQSVQYATLVFRAVRGDLPARSAAAFLADELGKSLELDLETARAFVPSRVLVTLT